MMDYWLDYYWFCHEFQKASKRLRSYINLKYSYLLKLNFSFNSEASVCTLYLENSVRGSIVRGF